MLMFLRMIVVVESIGELDEIFVEIVWFYEE